MSLSPLARACIVGACLVLTPFESTFGASRNDALVQTADAVEPPTNLTATSIFGDTVTIAWTAPANGALPTGYVLEGGVTPGAVLASVPTRSTATTFSFVAPTGTFYIRVHAIAGSLRSVASNEIRLFVNVPAPPAVPTNLLGLVNGSSGSLAWHDATVGGNTAVGGAPTGFILDVAGSRALSLNLPLTEAFSFADVPTGTYSLSLRAFNNIGVSGTSNSVTLTFPGPCSGAPATPTNFLWTKSIPHRTILGSTIGAWWDPPASGPAPTGYTLIVTGALVVNVPLTQRSIWGIVQPGSYTLSVVATNACGTSAATPPQTIPIP